MSPKPTTRSLLAGFGAVNPGMQAPEPAPMPGDFFRTDVSRTVLAGSIIEQYITPETFVPMERVYRRLTNEGVFTATPNKPTQITLGTFMVPQQMIFFMLDYRYDIYRPNGAVVGDFVPLENRRLSTSVGFLNEVIGQKMQGNNEYQLVASPPTADTGEFTTQNPGYIPGTTPGLAPNQAFERARFVSAQSTGGVGALSTMPQRHHRDGLMKAQYCWVIRAGQRFTMKAIVFNKSPIPIAFFEGNVTGVLIAQNAGEQILKAAATPLLPAGGV